MVYEKKNFEYLSRHYPLCCPKFSDLDKIHMEHIGLLNKHYMYYENKIKFFPNKTEKTTGACIYYKLTYEPSAQGN